MGRKGKFTAEEKLKYVLRCMEEVIYNSIISCCNSQCNEDINLIVEVGLLGNSNIKDRKIQSGVKIYNLTSKAPILLKDLGKANMGDPNNLYDFINYGTSNFPAAHYMLVLSGHGADFIGGMTDLSLDKNYIMGIPEMIKAIGLGCKPSEAAIDILLCDMCFMNSLEVLYEISHFHQYIKTFITYTNFAPYDGLDYKLLMKIINKISNIQDIRLYTTKLINEISFNLIGYKVDKTILNSIKELFNNLAYSYLLDKNNNINPLELIRNINSTSNFSDSIKTINNAIESLIINCKPRFYGINSSIDITHEDIGKLVSFYSKLAFAKNNYWTNLLSTQPLCEELTSTDKVKVRTMNSTISSVHYLLPLNPK